MRLWERNPIAAFHLGVGDANSLYAFLFRVCTASENFCFDSLYGFRFCSLGSFLIFLKHLFDAVLASSLAFHHLVLFGLLDVRDDASFAALTTISEQLYLFLKAEFVFLVHLFPGKDAQETFFGTCLCQFH